MSSAFDAALRAGRLTAQEALALFDSLDTAATTDLHGAGTGSGFPTGHPLDGVLAAWHWHGKRFDGDEHVHPLVMRSVRGARWHLDPLWANLALPLLLRWPWLKSPTAGRLAWPVLPVLGTRRSRARLRLLEHRGRLTAAMLYDMLPAHDVFRRVDADTVLGAMDWKGLERPLFFVLRRERPSRDSGAR
jgi:hypothetical protein